MLGDVAAFGGFSVDDLERARTFYAEVLGVSVRAADPGMPVMVLELAGGERPMVVYEKADHAPASFTVLNFPVADVAGTVAALRERGVVFERYAGSPMETDEDFVFRGGGPLIAWFTDPAGNVLSVIEDSGD